MHAQQVPLYSLIRHQRSRRFNVLILAFARQEGERNLGHKIHRIGNSISVWHKSIENFRKLLISRTGAAKVIDSQVLVLGIDRKIERK